MKKAGKKILCTFLAVLMCLTAAPLQGFVGLEFDLPDFSISANAASSNSCGYGVTWSISGSGVLTIRGSGAMYDYSRENPAPWLSYVDSITSVTVQYGVTKIGEYAFYDLENVTAISIPDTVTEIGERAFSWTGITSIVLPDGITRIEDGTLESCHELVDIVIPDGVTYIGKNAFEFCHKMTSITLPSALTYIDDEAFTCCFGLTSITIPDSVTHIGTGAFYITSIESVNIPAGMTRIENSTFKQCTHLTEITIPDNITYIGASAFAWCSGLVDVDIPDSVTYIGGGAFSGCPELFDITIPDTVTYIGSNVFGKSFLSNQYTGFYTDQENWIDGVLYCGNHLIVADPDVVSGIYTIREGTKTIAGDAFKDCKKLTRVVIPDSVVSIGEYAFSGTGLGNTYSSEDQEITISKNVSYIGEGAFIKNQYLRMIHVDEENTEYISENGVLYSADKSRLITVPCLNNSQVVEIPYGTDEIPEEFFKDCRLIQNVVIPETVTFIDDGAFSGCRKLTSIEIPEAVTYIGESAFYGCSSLKAIELPEGIDVIYAYTFDNCSSLSDITIPENVTYLYFTFKGCSNLSRIYIFNKDCTINNYDSGTLSGTIIFGYPGSTAETFANENGIKFASINVKDTDILASGTCGESASWSLTYGGTLRITGSDYVTEKTWDDYENFINKVVVADGIKGIGPSSFYGYNNLTSVTLPSSLHVIHNNAFYECTSLKTITMPGVVDIGDFAFYGCTALESVSIGDNRYIGEYAFYNCTALKTVYIGKSKVIREHAFNQCTALTDVYFSGSQKDWNKIYERYFYGSGLWSADVHFETNIEMKYDMYDKFVFGSFPQSIVEDTALIEQLNAGKESWTYVEDTYKGIKYAEMVLGENKYRARLDSAFENAVNWFVYEPITWTVFDPANGLIFADVAVDQRAYATSNVEFKDSELRKWLNEDFATQAFTASQRAKILTTTIRNDTFSTYDWDYVSKSETTETIFIPGATELTNGSLGFSSYPDASSSRRRALPTAYSLNKALTGNEKVYLSTRVDNHIFVSEYGCLNNGYSIGFDSELGIRPAMYVDIENIICEHYYYSKVTAPTCAKQGYTTHTCPCGDSYITDYVEKLPHSYTSKITTAATHLKEGLETFTCKCGDSYTEVVPKLEKHTYNGVVTSPTCKEGGYTTYTCACGDTYVGNYTNPRSHRYKSEITTQPTHLKEGVRTYTCSYSNCRDTYTEPVAKLTKHTYTSKITTQPTHLTEGVETYTCACGDSYTQPVAKLTKHTYTSEITTQPTHKETGIRTFTCECGDSYTETIAVVPHSYSKTVTAPTCTEGGYTTFTCVCGHSYIGDYTAEKGHSHEADVTAPTCTEGGYTTYTCICGDSYVADYTDAKGHSHVSRVTTPATHTSTGVMTYTCTCGDSYTDIIPKLSDNHSYTGKITTPATHLKEGVKTYTCECGDSYTESVAKLTGHTYSKKVTAPTCTAQGYTTYICECGHSYKGDYVGAKGHSEKSEITVSATHLSTGLKTYTCKVCGNTRTEDIPKIKDHSYFISDIVNPTCDKDGYTVYLCECGDSYKGDKVSKTGHDYNGDICKNCGKSKIDNCSCNCHKSGFMGFIWKIINFFNKLFKSNKTCACGVAHY